MVLQRMNARSVVDQFAKTALVHSRLTRPGPSLHVVGNWIGPVANRAALWSLLSGDWSLASYSANYFAKSLVPCKPCHVARATTAGVEPARVCLHCWHVNREVFEDSEVHVLMECPAHGPARDALILSISTCTFQAIADAPSNSDRLMALLGSADREDWQYIGKFLGQGRVKYAQNRSKRFHSQNRNHPKSQEFVIKAMHLSIYGTR